MKSDPSQAGALAAGQHHAKVGHHRRAGAERRVGDARAADASGRREHDAFGHQLPEDAEAAGAERRANRDLARAPEPAHDHQIGEVDTDDEQHRADGRQQQQDGAPDQRIDPLVIERDGGGTPRGIAGA